MWRQQQEGMIRPLKEMQPNENHNVFIQQQKYQKPIYDNSQSQQQQLVSDEIFSANINKSYNQQQLQNQQQNNLNPVQENSNPYASLYSDQQSNQEIDDIKKIVDSINDGFHWQNYKAALLYLTQKVDNKFKSKSVQLQKSVNDAKDKELVIQQLKEQKIELQVSDSEIQKWKELIKRLQNDIEEKEMMLNKVVRERNDALKDIEDLSISNKDQTILIEDYKQQIISQSQVVNQMAEEKLKLLQDVTDLNLWKEEVIAKEIEDKQLEEQIKEQLMERFSQERITNESRIRSDSTEEFNKLSKINEELQRISEEVKAKELELERNLIEKSQENQSLQYQLNRVIGKPFPISDMSNFYDIILKFNSILNCGKGWELEINKELRNNTDKFSKILKQESLLVGVIGLAKKGKSYFLSQLSGKPLPSSFAIKTEGLSIKMADVNEKMPIAFLDSEGFEAALEFYKEINELQKKLEEKNLTDATMSDSFSTEKQKTAIPLSNFLLDNDTFKNGVVNQTTQEYSLHTEYDNKLKNFESYKQLLLQDRAVTEAFIQDYILATCHLIILVVGSLSFSEQKLIQRVKQNHLNKHIIVIHNYFELSFIAEVDKKIKEDIINAFPVKAQPCYLESKQNFNAQVYYDYSSSTEKPIAHLPYAREGTEAGDQFNEATLAFVKMKLSTLTNTHSINLIHSVVDYFSKNFSSYLDIKGLDKPLELPENNFKFQMDEYEEDSGKYQLYSPTLREICENYNVNVRLCIFDALGNIVKMPRSDEYVPPYTMVDKKDSFILYYDLPQVNEDYDVEKELDVRFHLDSEFYYFALEGRRKMCVEIESSAVISDRMNFGIIQHFTKIAPRNSVLIDINKPPICSYTNGVLKVVIQKMPETAMKIRINKLQIN